MSNISDVVGKNLILLSQLQTQFKDIIEEHGSNKFTAQAMCTLEELKILTGRLKLLSETVESRLPTKPENLIEN